MKLIRLLLPVSFIVLLVPGISAATSEATDKAKPAVADSPVRALKQGIPALEVKKALGEPTEIKPMKAPNGKAEVWVYVHEISRRSEQISAASSDLVYTAPESDGSVRQHVIPGQVTVHYLQYVKEEITEVLMFNDHFVTHKVTFVERKL